ncbi:MAG: phage portal protein [Peptococcaceae bacterium]|nr:phage portal protein [Peptococcaceae bacterium]
MFILPEGEQLTPEKMSKFIQQHEIECTRYTRLKNMYDGKHPILVQAAKPAYKPDNRLVVNFAKYITDTYNGFFMGNPVKVLHVNDVVAAFLQFLNRYNNQDDNNAELSKMCSIYGHAFELLYLDENSNVGIAPLSPQNCFLIYDESIVGNPIYGVHYYKNTKGHIEGTFSDDEEITHFRDDAGEIRLLHKKPQRFCAVPIIEYVENAERIGAFESVETLINAYNKALSEKANDVDYYADAYLSILGAALDEKTLAELRNSRIINIEGEIGNSDKITVEFLSKPESDGTQENLINRLEQLIFQISLVANIGDEDFGGSSGVSLRYKLQGMSNLGMTKERKFTASMINRYKTIANIPSSPLAGEWQNITYKFTRNVPANLLEESTIAANLWGIVSEETLYQNVISAVDDVKTELRRIAEARESGSGQYVRALKKLNGEEAK